MEEFFLESITILADFLMRYGYFHLTQFMKSTLKLLILFCLIYFTWQGSFQCNVQNCQYCSYPNFCGQCQPNNLLTWNNATNTFSCTPLTCALNCQTCYVNGQCQVCNPGYFLTINSTCSQNQTSATNLSINCLWGISPENCDVCAYGYSLQAGYCYPIFVTPPNFQNCLIQQAPMICQICQPSYFVGPLGNCIPISTINQTNCNSANCAYCSNALSNNTNASCTICMPGFQLTSQQTCTNTTCNTPGCATCNIYGQCSSCIIGYVFNSQNNTCTLVGYGCADPNCLICDGPQSCGQCKYGWTNDNYLLSAGVTVKLCHPLACPYNVTNCAKCSYQYSALFNFRTVLCSQCNPGFNIVNGYCVAQVSTIAFTCNSQPNCASCSFNNFCSSCNPGYVLSPLGNCLPAQCNIPNCASCSANFVCQACNAGFTLSLGFLSYTNQPISNFVTNLLTIQCIPSSVTCQIANCAYCSINNTCSICASGYDFSSTNVCSPACSVTNCLECMEGYSLYCLTCKPGYTLGSSGQSCTAIVYSCPGCQNFNNTCFYNWATQQGSCTQCSSGMLLYQGSCYSASCNIYGCNQCSTWVNPPVCLRCNQGLILSNGYCQQLNCNNNVANCILCIQTGACLGCAQGFLLVNTSGISSCVAQNTTCQDPNCLQCSTNGITCFKCAMPYKISNGACVCGFQNCLQCSTSGITCDTCPFPLFSSFATQGCVPSPSLKLPCTISNCQLCLTPTKCSICAIGYSLNPSTYQCIYNNCSSLGLSNCQLCDSFGYLCHQCNAGFMPNNVQQGGQCMPINPGYTCNISGCAICSATNNLVCANCLPGYYSNGTTQCLPNFCNIQNCYMCLQSNICYQCISGFYLTVTDGQQTCTVTRGNLINCQGQIANCAICVINFINSPNTVNKTYCVQCNNGFQFDPTNSVCIPQTNSIPNCKVQANLGYFTPPICLVCEQGFYISSWSTCSQYNPAIPNAYCPVYNCLYCSNSSTCSFCFAPWGISATGLCQTSANCSANCQFCTNASICLTCNNGYSLNPPNTCVACNIANCQLCQQPNICVFCNAGFSLTGSNTCISCNIPGCLNCSNPNICSTCGNSASGSPQLPSPTGSACYPCNQTLSNLINCLSCGSANSCGLCQNGYQLYYPLGLPGTCIMCNIPNCISCALSGLTVYCQACAVGYSQNNGNCVQCLFPCVSCNSNPGPNNCVLCQQPFYFSTALANGTCLPNSIPNCISYNSSSITQCTACSTYFTLNLTSNLCQFNCPSSCQICSSPNVCTQCVQGYFLLGNGTCSQCQITGCASCTSDGMTCNQCFTGFYPISEECRVCPGYCASCTSSTSCTALVQSTQQVLIMLNQGTVLAVCQQNCLTCSNLNPQVCLQCTQGFYLSGGNCFQCSSNCMTCSSTNQGQCFSCYPNNFLSGSICSTCSLNCLTCQSPSQPNFCTSCNSGFYLSNSTCVQGCSLNCFSCSSATVCLQCLSGYTLYFQNNQTICVPCTTSCRTCASGQPGACLSCGIGFFLSGTTCIQCSPNCNSCTATGCISCISGFFLTSTQSCSPNCAVPCATCSAVTPTKCTSCIAGYNYNDQANSCTAVPTCTGPCQVCPLGYALSFGKCIQCTSSQCETCNPNSPSQCYSCLPGFFLNPSTSQCQACPSNCQTCLTSTGCLTCATGFTTIQNAPLTSSGYQCVTCNFPCATCTNSPNYCTSCVAGYQFMGWKCSQSFYFGFQVTLLTMVSIFNQNYYNFIVALTQAIGASTTNAITIISINSGSVVVVGGAGPSGASGSKQAGQQFSNLESILSANGQIANMPIGDSTVVVVGGTVDYSEINLVLILGICIPVGVLLIAGIILYIYCKRKRSTNVIEEKIYDDSRFSVNRSFQLSHQQKDEYTLRPFEEITTVKNK